MMRRQPFCASLLARRMVVVSKHSASIPFTTMAMLDLTKLASLREQCSSVREHELRQFESSFEWIVNYFTSKAKDEDVNNNPGSCEHSVEVSDMFHLDPRTMSPVTEWLKSMLVYNVPHGKLNRGLSLVINYRILGEGFPLSMNEPSGPGIARARIVAWCVELLQSYFLVLDDIMDHSITRRGRDCWYRKASVGMMACNDSTLLMSTVYRLLSEHLSDHPHYTEIVHLMNDGFNITGYGQCLDILTENQSKAETTFNLADYTEDKYNTIVKWKTAFYTFILPARLAFYLQNRNDPSEHRALEAILNKIGHLFQVQDDYLDCFGDPSTIGKIGMDIRDGKCSWLVVQALARVDALQRDVLARNYGRNDATCEAMVKQLYQQLDMPHVYASFEKDTLQQIVADINACCKLTNIPVAVFYEPLLQVYNRQK